ncbi:hypothetical protein [Pseudothermotoga thermarum]|uniref:Uncharacterized protein n=1 Tax=Pseudothermotoga thermarum DSM 5069 TaxID=688269 RepID=F7YTU7_9THEM|nr:hypothetical protein [Pseudothermotoga thermarum]AEH51392.1 hypothetical protein Theth_1328 [Pseudothermotoga thermarum DSM 5069]
MLTIGILGTAKNTGKTTTLNVALKCLSNLKLAVTSIGFDGEDFDFVTGLPKPKIFVEEGCLVVTSAKAAKHSTAKLEFLKSLSFKTPMGEVGLYKVKETGTVVLVGPSSSQDLLTALKEVQEYNVDVFLIDGAVNRMMPFQHVDYVVIATGAAKSTDLEELFLEMKVFVKVFQLPAVKEKPTIRGLVTLQKLLESRDESIVVESPFHLLLSAEPKMLDGVLDTVKISLSRKPKLLCITVNPCYPEKRFDDYKLSKVDLTPLVSKLRTSLGIITVDVEQNENEFCRLLTRVVERNGGVES